MVKPTAAYFVDQCVKSYIRERVVWRHRDTGAEATFDRAPWGVTITWTGTNEPIDVWYDVRFAPWYAPGVGWAPAGFLKGACSLYGAIEPALKVARASGAPVFQNGHSLGGAYATIACGLMLASGHAPAGLFTCGAPRACSSGLVKRLGDAGVKRRRLVLEGDPVPEMMPSFGGLYQHFAPETLLKKKGDLLPDHPSARYLEYTPEDMLAF